MAEPTLERSGSAADGLVGMANVFIDPAATAKRIPSKGFWIWPVVTVAVVYVIFGYLMLPYTLQMVDNRMSQQFSASNTPPEQVERAQKIAHTMSQVGVPLAPVFVILFLAIFAGLVLGMCSVAGVKTKFRDIFSLLAVCSLITMLQYIATFIVIKAKGDEITSPEQLTPAFGLDIFAQGLHGVALAFLNFFSVFEIWYIVILGLTFAALTGASKGKAFIATSPAWVIALLFKLAAAALTKS
jgi:hypothetical protein